MSGAVSVIAAAAVVAGATLYSSEQQRKAQGKAQDQARRQALAAEKAADEASNRANQKKPDTMSLLSSAEQAAKGGVSGTMLTGPQGVDQNALALGKSSLLGS